MYLFPFYFANFKQWLCLQVIQDAEKGHTPIFKIKIQTIQIKRNPHIILKWFSLNNKKNCSIHIINPFS